jgi:hypothetical protein
MAGDETYSYGEFPEGMELMADNTDEVLKFFP